MPGWSPALTSAGKVGPRRQEDRQRPSEVGLLGGGVLDAPLFPAAKSWMQRREKKRGKKKAHAILAAKLGRTVYHMLRRGQAFDLQRFLGQ